MPETEPMMCYAWSFIGAPTAALPVHDTAWLQVPGLKRLAATRATVALERARKPEVAIYRCVVSVRGTDIECTDAMLLGEIDASQALRYFASYCARSVLDQWNPNDIVRHYLHTGDAALRGAAHHSAWIASSELEGRARLAARVAMYAAHADQVAMSTREAARIALSLRGSDSLQAASLAHYHQERVLSAALMLTVDDACVMRAA